MIASLGIPSANRLPVSETASALPSLRSTLVGWFRPIVLGRVTTNLVDGEALRVVREQTCRGMVQPFGPRELKLKPEGERSWNWQMLHTDPSVSLKDGEEFSVKGVKYRVMSQKNYSEYGYVMYELVQDYAPVARTSS